MPLEMDVIGLSAAQRAACQNTIGPHTFFMLVADALVSGTALSCVRMGDGEKSLFLRSQNYPGTRITNEPYGEEWLRGLGCYGIPTNELYRRLKIAAEESTYFAPNIMGIQRPEFGVADVFAPRERYVDNWFVRTWSRKLQDQLYKQAGRVLFIHTSQEVRERFVSRVGELAAVDCLAMCTWEDADTVISLASPHSAPLVLFAGGPTNKHIAPIIAADGCRPKVVLDLGHAAEKEWI